jgi:hypothetical protein
MILSKSTYMAAQCENGDARGKGKEGRTALPPKLVKEADFIERNQLAGPSCSGRSKLCLHSL